MIDFESKFELMNLSGKSIASMIERLSNNTDLAREFMFNRMGVNTDNTDGVRVGLKAFQDGGWIGEDASPENAFTRPQDFVTTACIMSESITSAELKKCIDSSLAQFTTVSPNEAWEEKFLVDWYWASY